MDSVVGDVTERLVRKQGQSRLCVALGYVCNGYCVLYCLLLGGLTYRRVSHLEVLREREKDAKGYKDVG